jgi:hypothetical protein
MVTNPLYARNVDEKIICCALEGNDFGPKRPFSVVVEPRPVKSRVHTAPNIGHLAGPFPIH